MCRPPVVVLTTREQAPAGSLGLADTLWPRPGERWAQRYGLERLRLLGDWVRRLHRGDAVPPRAQQSADGAPVGAVDALRERLAAGPPPPPATGWPPLPRAHWTSLRQWAELLTAPPGTPGPTTHGRLGLDHVGWVTAPPGDLVVLAPGGLAATHPAVDVGWVTGDLIELVHRARAHGRDPAPFERLLAAFLSGYRGLIGEPAVAGDGLDTYRAAALRVLSRVTDEVAPEDAALDLRLAQHLVEQCWAAGARR
ncbi:hypothetical protein [Modestobacter italicus]|uniref:hypothetical protein n=1 Tax=Modestobacter italicus (strain DSM 44449 / CECT 9708 / BC 501) TaxID=2732864 RepID=UPI001C942BA8|nr:hypothetical protein [Modestobacter italicus]